MALSVQAPWCLADRGTVQKVIVLPRDDMETEELMLEEIEVFKVRAGWLGYPTAAAEHPFLTPCPELMGHHRHQVSLSQPWSFWDTNQSHG